MGSKVGGTGRGLFLASLGTTLLAALLAARHTPFHEHRLGMLLALGLGTLGWWWACSLAARGRGSFREVCVGAILLRAIFFIAPNPGLSDDVNRYVFEGEVLASGISPYAFAPDDPSLEEIRRRLPEIYDGINHKDVPAAYPPIVQVAGAGVVAAASSFGADEIRGGLGIVRWMRGFYALCDLLVLVPLAGLLRAAGLNASRAVVWGWSPLVAIEFAGSGHFDSLGVLLWMGSFWFLAESRARGRLGISSLLAAAAILVKYLPICGLPFAFRRRGRELTVVLVICAASFLPILLLRGGFAPGGGGLGNYAFRWESASLVHRFVEAGFDSIFTEDESFLDPRLLSRLAMGGAWLAVAVYLFRRGSSPLLGSGVLVGSFLLLTPTLHPWYLVWIVPFLAFRSSVGFLWLLGVGPLIYWPVERWVREGTWEEPAWLWPVLALPLAIGLALDLVRWRSREGRA